MCITAAFIAFTKQLQDTLCARLSAMDGALLLNEDSWQRPGGGGGITRALAAGQIFEQGGINFSHVMGDALPASATIRRPHLAGKPFEAVGLSLVLHTVNPMVPASHMNVRFFIAHTETPCWWFGGGFDLSPYYGFVEDCRHWHTTAKSACQPFGDDVYPRFKRWCDDYFYIRHRQEHRGIGGLFFDDLNSWPQQRCFEFVQRVGEHFLPALLPIVQRRADMPYSQQQKAFQRYRRGRYVEFNLVYDRGTLFGLQSGGRTESILVSLPPEVTWQYAMQPAANTAESLLTTFYLKPRDWTVANIQEPSLVTTL